LLRLLTVEPGRPAARVPPPRRRRDDALCDPRAVPRRARIAHGGIVATLLDEVSCAAVFFLHDRFVVTGELTVRYERPCPVETPLDVRGRVTNGHPRYAVVEAEIRQGDVVLARSSGKFFYQTRTEPAP
jgi:acyl-coenzyme A thioesterase PaaI-like protein